jgi:hypothetical protein
MNFLSSPPRPDRHKWFKEGRENVEDENAEKVQDVVHSNRRLSIRAWALQLNVDKH